MTFRWILTSAIVLGLVIVANAWIEPVSARQGPPQKKKTEEEEEAPKKGDKQKPKEEEEEKRDKPGTPPKKEEEEETPRKPRGAVTGPVNLAEEAKRERDPRLKKLLENYGQIYDTVTTRNGTEYRTAPIPEKLGTGRGREMTFQRLTPQGGLSDKLTLNRDMIKEVTHYELRAQRDVRNLVEALSDQQTLGKSPRSRALRVAEMVLSEALRFHVGARANNQRSGPDWVGLESELRRELRQIQISQIRALTAEKSFEEAEDLSQKLYKEGPPSRELAAAIEQVYSSQAQAAISQGEYLKVRGYLENYARAFPTEPSAELEKIQRLVEDKARDLLEESRSLAGKGDLTAAVKVLTMAERIWPRLQGLREQRLQFQKSYPVLRVGVRALPGQVSPTSAESDADRMAVRLVFESLLQLWAAPSAREGYLSKLGVDPRLTSDGWEFTLPTEVTWSDGKPVTAADVKRSVEILCDPRVPYYDPAAAELMRDQVRVDDAQRVTLTLARGCVDPLSFFTFNLLPAHHFPADKSPRNPVFGRAPVGTGPFVFKGMDDGEAVFVANPGYRRPGGPQLREIRLAAYGTIAEARESLSIGRWQMALDLTTREKEELDGVSEVQTVTVTDLKDPRPPYLVNPRVFLLAPNYRKPAMQNKDLRLAINLGINREQVLNEVFRGRGKKYHQVATGPFPNGSWACHPDFGPDKVNLYRPEEAKAAAGRARARLGNVPELSLFYPSDLPQANLACAQIAAMLGEVGVKVRPQGLVRTKFTAELLRDKPEFDLVYWPLDFENETLSLWPYFDPNGIGASGRNFMGYSGELEGLFRELQNRRDFSAISRQSQTLHEMIQANAILIPLWQLDRHIAVSRNLKATRFHPLWVFDNVEEWKLEFPN